jgi:predicted permease
VTSAGAVSLAPLEGVTTGLGGLIVNGRAIAGSGDRMMTYVGFITPGYLATMGIGLQGGRDFAEPDRLGAPLVAIVNEAFQRRFAPDGRILGARIRSGSGPEEFTVVGITRDVPDSSLRTPPEPLLMAPLAQMPGVHIGWGSLTFALRTDGRDPRQLAPEVRRAIWAIDPSIVITGLVPMTERLAVGVRTERDSALLFGLFALAALLMAAIGVYGVAAFAIAQRTREIGIRVALGAMRTQVRGLVIRQTLMPTLVGIAVGIVAAVALTQLLGSMVYGVAPLDPLTFATAGVVLVAMAITATWAPARRATRIDPLRALRYE